jgi:hypothetical protein
VSHRRRFVTFAALLLTVAAATPARADSPFSIVFGLDQQHRPAFSIQAFGPTKGQKLIRIDSIDNSGRPPLYTEFKPPSSSQAPSPGVPANGKQSRAAGLINGTLQLLRSLLPHH